MKLLVVGSVAYDSVETPFEKGEDLLGGSATYFSTAASKLASTGVVAVVGEDFGQNDLDHFARHGVDASGLERVAGKSFRWGGRYHDDMNGRDTLYTHLNVFESFEPKLPEAYRDAPYIFLANIDPELQLHVLDQVTAPKFVACDTMNFWIEGPKREALDRLLKRVNAIVINDEEVRLLTGEHSVVRAARQVLRMGPETVIVKRGEHGALMFHGDEIFFAPAYPLEEVRDPTGAGDTFAGGMMGWIASRDDAGSETMRQALVAGSLFASFCVEGLGLSALTKIEMGHIHERYRSHMRLTHCDKLELNL